MAISCGFDWNQLVLYIVQLDNTRPDRAVLKVQRNGFQGVIAEFFPSFRLSEDGMAECPGVISALLRVADLEDELHANSIPESESGIVELEQSFGANNAGAVFRGLDELDRPATGWPGLETESRWHLCNL